MTDLFPAAFSDSPRLRFFREHGLISRHYDHDIPTPGAGHHRFLVGNRAMTCVAFADSEDDAIWAFCRRFGVRHYADESGVKDMQAEKAPGVAGVQTEFGEHRYAITREYGAHLEAGRITAIDERQSPSLAGYQNIVHGTVQEGDWVIRKGYEWPDGEWAHMLIGDDIETIASIWRVYRKVPVPQQTRG